MRTKMQELSRDKMSKQYPLIKLKGKDYLQVAYRLQWLNDENKSFRIETEFIHVGDDFAVCKAKITCGEKYAEATKREDKSHFVDFIEKSETGSIGRALALIGFGTQYAQPDLDEGERVVDAPLETKVIDNLPKINKLIAKPITKKPITQIEKGESDGSEKSKESLKEDNKEIKQEVKTPLGDEIILSVSSPRELPFEPTAPYIRSKIRMELVDAFDKIGVRQDRIKAKYGVEHINLTDEMVEDLRDIYRKIKQGLILKNQVFPLTNFGKK